jgi:SAM-dependent methyltransferase
VTVTAASIQAEFDAKAKSYETGRLAAWYQAQDELVLAHAHPRAGDTVLDVGCGTGWLLRHLMGRHSGVTGLGLDISPAMIAAARERARVEGISGLTFVTGDWMQIDPLPLLQAHGLRSTELAICVSTFHYFSDPARALENIFEAVGPGGRLLLLDRARDGSAMTMLWDLIHRAILRDTARFYRADEMVALAESAGFTNVREIARVRKLFWKGKMATSLALIGGRRP